MKDVKDVKVSDVKWARRRIIGCGAEGVVYLVAPGVVAKVGTIDPQGVAAQRKLAEEGYAVPVLDYQSGTSLPADVAAEVCDYHGVRQLPLPSYLADEKDKVVRSLCLCTRRISYVLLMPRARRITREERRSRNVQNFLRRARRRCKKYNIALDNDNPDNVMRYNDHYGVIDVKQRFVMSETERGEGIGAAESTIGSRTNTSE